MENTLIDGFYVDKPNEKAPDFVIAKISVTPKFIEFYEKNKDEKGGIRGDILQARSGKYYAKLDDWKPKEQKKEENTEINTSDIPF